MLAIVDTDMTALEVDDIIDEVDDLMDLMMNTGGLGANILRLISRRWSAYSVMLKDPDARSLGEYSERRSETLRRLWEQIEYYILMASGGMAFTAASETLA